MWNVLERLFYLHAFYLIEKYATDFLEDGYLSKQQVMWVRSHIDDLLEQIRPDAVSITDAWDFCDEELQSSLGRYDGNVYEAYTNW